MINRKVALWATTALVGTLLASTSAFAQSTGTQEVEDVVITATRGTPTVDGAISAEQVNKTRSTVTQEFINTQASGQTILQTVNLVPGVNFTNNDAFGNSGGNIRIRGFDGNRISLTFDGIPLNDTGNYAIFSNQMMDPELIEKASVNVGTTDVDSPTASATGGTVSYVTRKPTQDFGVTIQPSVGDFNYHRVFALVDTGEIGPYGTTAFIAGSYGRYDKFKGPGEQYKRQFNARIYQPLGDNGDFISVAFHYNVNRNNFYRNLNLGQIAFYGDQYDNLSQCTRDPATPGVADNENASPDGTHAGLYQANGDNPNNTSSCSNYYGVRINPSNTGNIRLSGRFTLADNLTLTVDPSFQYVLANGGGSTTVSERDRTVEGAIFNGNAGVTAANGVDLNGDGDTLDTIRFYTPNTTNTRRYGLTSSLIWDINDDQRLRVAYTYDMGRHRQTGEWSPLDSTGDPLDVFGGKDGYGPRVYNRDGYFLRQRDRFSIATLQQLAIDYNGRFFDDMLRVNIGVRDPHFTRELNQYCPTASSGFAYCTSETVGGTDANGYIFFIGHPADKYVPAFTATKKYSKVLPNVGISLRPWGPEHVFYLSYAEGFSAPRTDNLYAYGVPNVDHGIPHIDPETTNTYDLGYRYQTGRVVLSTALWQTKYHDRIVSSFDQTCNCFIDRNIGDVDQWGWDGEAGVRLTDAFSVYGSASYNKSEIQSDLPARTTGGVATFLPTKGKKLVETPDWTLSGRAQYEDGPWRIGVQAKYVGDRFSTDVNNEKVDAYTLVDADVQFDLTAWGFEGSYLQLNALNITDESWVGSISSTNSAVTVTTPQGNVNGSAPTYAIGYPRTLMLTLRARF